jgi:hypothetical protein
MKWSRTVQEEEHRQTMANIRDREEREGGTFDADGPHLIDLSEVVLLPGGSSANATRLGKGDRLRLRCDAEGCRQEADAIHFTRWIVGIGPTEGPDEIQAACPDHDPGGYWIKIADLRDDPLALLTHLAVKRGDGAQQLLRWLGEGPYRSRGR